MTESEDILAGNAPAGPVINTGGVVHADHAEILPDGRVLLKGPDTQHAGPKEAIMTPEDLAEIEARLSTAELDGPDGDYNWNAAYRQHVPALVAEVRGLTLSRDEFRDATCRLTKNLTKAYAEIDTLRAIVDRLPKTADGAPVMPGDEIWYDCHHHLSIHSYVVEYSHGGYRAWSVTCPNISLDYCYSTREAAMAAKENTHER